MGITLITLAVGLPGARAMGGRPSIIGGLSMQKNGLLLRNLGFRVLIPLSWKIIMDKGMEHEMETGGI